MIFHLFLNCFFTNIANRLFIVIYDFDVICDFRNEEAGDRDEVSENDDEQIIDAFIIVIELNEDSAIADVDLKVIKELSDDVNETMFNCLIDLNDDIEK